MTPKTAPTPMIALETVHLEHAVIRKGDQYMSDDPIVTARPQFFIAADAPQQQVRQAQADNFAKSTEGAWQPDPPPPPIKMKATRRFVAEVVTSKNIDVAAGEEVMSNDDLFLDNPTMFEPVRGGKRNGR